MNATSDANLRRDPQRGSVQKPVLWIASIALLAALAGGGIFLWKSGDAQPAKPPSRLAGTVTEFSLSQIPAVTQQPTPVAKPGPTSSATVKPAVEPRSKPDDGTGTQVVVVRKPDLPASSSTSPSPPSKTAGVSATPAPPTTIGPYSPQKPQPLVPLAPITPPPMPSAASQQPLKPTPEPVTIVATRPPVAPQTVASTSISHPPMPPPQRVLFSDSFRRADAGPWALGMSDLAFGGSARVLYLPLGGGPNVVGAIICGGVLQNKSLDYGGIQFARSLNDRGVDIGQDLNIRADIFVPTDAERHITQAGPYFRSRAAAAGDGIIGGTSAGYWIMLCSNGEVIVKLLNGAAPSPFAASSGRLPGFDPRAYHTLEMAAQGESLEVALDGRLLMFRQAGRYVTRVRIPPVWLGPPPTGFNNGTAGIWFGCEDNRGKIGGQCVANLVVTRYGPLSGLPVYNPYTR
ncbi:MAG: hypothetical protein HZC54_12135 [Verrucomicrobia bacterium]|nr:hypothetical protein [Verrucomicrobiota bacterium]